LLRTNWEEMAWEEVANATTAAAVRVLKCMFVVADGYVARDGGLRYRSSGGSGVLLKLERGGREAICTPSAKPR
jgi:hypothetical protein